MMRKTLLLLLAAVLCGSLPAQDTEETARLLALFNSHPKADIAVELVKKHDGGGSGSPAPQGFGGALQAVPQVWQGRIAFNCPELQCGSRGAARSWRTLEKQTCPQAGSREQGHLP